MPDKDGKVVDKDKVNGIEVASLTAALVIVIIIVYVSATGVSKLFKQQVSGLAEPEVEVEVASEVTK